MNLKRIETFVLVATLRSFRKAAEQQFTTQPAISSRIAGLEKELGVILFDRDASPISLTAKGRELLPYAEKMLISAEQFERRAENNALLSGTLRLGVSESIVHTWLTAFLRCLHDKFPSLDIDVTVDVTSNLRHDLLDRTLDLAFLMGPVSEPSVTNLPLCSYPLAWVASPSIALPDSVESLEHLAPWPIITYARNTLPFCEIKEHVAQADVSGVHFFTSSSLSACLRMTADGLGVATLPMAIAAPEIASGRLRIVECNWTPSPLEFTASFMRAPLNGAAQEAAKLATKVAARHAGEHTLIA
ncbi:LysR family transcriptional regulator [Enterovibrio norvegicus]|uniref:DNA-binding transcriptional regulator, LysR family n=2 Tax=Enterovibrio norvegicus TaxID=188144 RepID=A0A1I5U0M0_9GAMM|nr:LysR family transcriptional regulator [Enterovibrio norvegicus]MCC4800052.1 LysR family transcriptional regulator [Enterovibrio norvegicus]OEE51084.1 LysR family transcriptional regulator [Enterovibrio norvegicus]PMI27245.1 LysR family transcriptional regulator [Enterovibrio norvegicus]PMI32701.1 LysR family transcriptional regulator [Enterovibrio norvegicus]PMN52868.1 LysR family transcriptional regulator [Enterovibrio norvegicus]